MERYIRIVPNILSATRLLLACIFPFSPERIWIWLIIGSGSSDFLDGWIARRWKAESWLGGLLDAFADKLFILIALISFSAAEKFSAWWIPAVIARDLTIGVAAGYAVYRRLWKPFKEIKARVPGKLATAGQFFLLIVALLFPEWTLIALFLALILSLIAAFDYGLLFYRISHIQNL